MATAALPLGNLDSLSAEQGVLRAGARTARAARGSTPYAAALAAGATDTGAPGLRWYHPDDYGAYVLDPAGNNIDAVCHEPAG